MARGLPGWRFRRGIRAVSEEARETPRFPSRSQLASCALGTPHLLSHFVQRSVPGRMEFLLPPFSGEEAGPGKLRHSPATAQVEYHRGWIICHSQFFQVGLRAALASSLELGAGGGPAIQGHLRDEVTVWDCL